MEHLIAKYLNGELTLEEQEQLSIWLDSDHRNAQTFQQIKTYWLYHKGNLDEEDKAVRARILQKMQAEQHMVPEINKKVARLPIYRIAASIIIIFSFLSIIYFYSSQKRDMPNSATVALIERVSPSGQKVTTNLPDGTIVTLNGDSKLYLPSKFDGDTREVTLVGEAFFNVHHNEEKPFIIKTEKIDIQVLGTSFNVLAYKDTDPEVAVKTGKVMVSDLKDKKVVLHPNQMAKLEGKELEKSVIPERAKPFAWTDHHLVFEKESIQQVFKRLSRWFGVSFEQSTKIKTRKKFTATYEDPTLQEVMDMLAFIYDFQYEVNEKEKKVIIQ